MSANLLLFSAMVSQARLVCRYPRLRLPRSPAAFWPCGSRQQDLRGLQPRRLVVALESVEQNLLPPVEGLLAQLVNRLGQRTRPQRQDPDPALGALPEPQDREGKGAYGGRWQ
jgi:hypothetical protein